MEESATAKGLIYAAGTLVSRTVLAPLLTSERALATTSPAKFQSGPSSLPLRFCNFLSHSRMQSTKRSDPLLLEILSLSSSFHPTFLGFPRRMPCQTNNLNLETRWRLCYRLSLPRNRGPDGRGKRQLPFLFLLVLSCLR